MIVRFEEAHDEQTFGGKSHKLGGALRASLPVPGGVALGWELVARIGAGEALPASAELDAVDLSSGVAVRSSAIGEDAGSTSFAGQHATVLGVRSRAGLLDAIRKVHASAHAPAALAYRNKLGIEGAPRMGVAIQRLVHAEVAGVLFSRDPIDGSDVRVIESAWGLGEVVVAGLITPDRFRVARGGRVLERHAGEKDIEVRWAEEDEGTVEVPIEGDRVTALTLDDARLAMLDALATRCEAAFGGAQDIEFAFVKDTLHLLQQRAITRG
jgi:pyruvate,water dikinase